MKFALALATASSISQAVQLQQSGYVIDLCPDVAAAQYAAPMNYNMPSSEILSEVLRDVDRLSLNQDAVNMLRAEKEGIAAAVELAKIDRLAKIERLEKLGTIEALASAIQETRLNNQQ